MNRSYEAQSFDGLAERYDAVISIERDHHFFLRNLPVRRGSVLDVGCGTGLLAHELSHHFDTVLALDISESMLAIARRKRSATNIEYRLSDANNLKLSTRFDTIVSHTTFHHLANIPRTLSVLAAALEPGGRLILIDSIARFSPVIPRWTAYYYAYAVLRWVPDIVRSGSQAANTLLQFRISREWIAHLRSDQYLTQEQFCKTYGDALFGAQFTRMRSFMGLVWTAPGDCGKR